MQPLWPLLALIACGPTRPPVAHPVPGDGARLPFEGPVRLAVVGPERGGSPVGPIADWAPHVVLRSGDLVARSSPEAWEAVEARWGRLLDVTIAAAGAGERRSDPKLRRFRAVFPGLGVPELTGAHWHVDLALPDTVWRLVVLDGAATGATLDDQRHWLPKVIADRDYDHLLLLLGVDAERAGPLLELVQDHAPVDRPLVTVVGGETPSARTPEGPYGPVQITAGDADRGWWALTLDGRDVDVRHHPSDADPAWAGHTSAAGWVVDR